MARDFLKILQEVRGTGAAEAEYTDGIWYDIAVKLYNSNPGMYGDILYMYTEMRPVINNLTSVITVSDHIDDVITVAGIEVEVIILAAIETEIKSLYADRDALNSLYADKATLDSLYADKVTLDSLYTDKITLDSLFADKTTLDSLFSDKATLDSLYADKIALDAVYANLGDINIIADNMDEVTYFADIYQGPKDIEPTERNDMSPLQSGDLYYDVSYVDPIDYVMRTYNGGSWEVGYAHAYARADSDVFHRRIPMEVRAGEALVRGDLVKFHAYDPTADIIEVVKTDLQADICIGIVDTVMASGEIGDIVVRGLVTHLDTSGQAEGTVMYSNGSGEDTAVKPVDTYQATTYVIKSNGTTGAVMVNISEPVIRQNLTYTVTSTNGTVVSPDGTDAVVPAATQTEAGLLTAADKVRLDDIEDSATRDQTDAEIKTAYENNTNTNEYSDAEEVKVGYLSVTQNINLDNIASEGSASTAHITSNGSDHGFIDQDVTTAATPTFAGIITGGDVDGRDVSTDGAKLDLIEGSATADQTATEIETLYEGILDTNKFTDGQKADLLALRVIHDETNEPTGFNRDDPSSMGHLEASPDGIAIYGVDKDGAFYSNSSGNFGDGTPFQEAAAARTFAIFPATGETEFSFYVQGKKFTKTAMQTVQAETVPGKKYTCFDNEGVLNVVNVLSSQFYMTNCCVSVSYGNPGTGEKVVHTDERHGIQMDGATHRYLHDTIGTQYHAGLNIQGLADGAGDYAQITSGVIYNEDIRINIQGEKGKGEKRK